MTQEEHDMDMIESIEMWLHEIEPKWVEKELAWLEELRTRLIEEKSEKPMNPSNGGLKKEIDSYFKDWYVDESDQGYSLKTPTGSAVMGNMEDVARHFYEIGCRRTAEMYDEIEYNRQMAEERQMAKEIPNDLTGTRY